MAAPIADAVPILPGEATIPMTISLDEAQDSLRELIARLAPGEELVITDEERPVARLVTLQARPTRPAPGLGRGGIVYMAPDFNDSIEAFGGEAG